ncbi:polygalacturonase-like [Diorhabda carinulata]|uniref:polygalacturonase-like n=1 Tax=Diorhabda carinulata TaxID=1163345 RepID=UPI0025A18972|nr:polygalacturonase-like [Diorhabda carinulata]
MSKYTIILVISLLAVASAEFNETRVGASCTITDYSQVDSVVKSCTTIVVSNLHVSAGKTLKLHLKSGTKLTFQGKVTFDHHAWDGPLVELQGTNIYVTGASGHVLDGEGAKYWDGKGDKGGKKPKFFRIKNSSGKVENIHLLNCPHQCASILSSKSLTLSNWNIDVSAGDANALGHNTDGFDVSECDGLLIQNCVVKNQDDCIAVNSGKNLHFDKMYCSGGHGLSLSIGVSKTDSSKNYAQNVTFSNSNVVNSRNAIHVKTHTDAASGYIKDLTYRNIQMSGITHYGINVQEDYKGGSSTGKASNNIPITNMMVNTVKGTMTSSNAMPVYILCGSSGCSNFQWSGVSISGGHKSSQCNYHPSGFSC